MAHDSAARWPVYEILPVLDDPMYEGFAFEDDSPLKEDGDDDGDIIYDFMPNDISTKGRAWTAPRLAEVWTPRKVVGRTCTGSP